ncbi:MAG TPA: protein-disulfide reductase DsbD domain-containing protein [Thermoanaerobaculia bacterium]|nr:protein-disulfide reductase DsbD domain-containing protein [Thermoanaerobaculia bacterium]
MKTPGPLRDLQVGSRARELRAAAVAAVLLATSFLASTLYAAPVSTPHVQAELLLEKRSVAPGESFDVALRMRMKEGWHTYWKHPGDSGEATELSWKLPPGFTAGDIQWPYPQNISLAPLTTYGYEGEVMLLVPFKAAGDVKPGTTARVTADAYWMVCEKVCIPEEVTLALDIPIGAAPVAPPAPNASAFASTRAKLPKPTDDWKIAASEQDQQFVLRIEPPQGVALDGGVQFFAASGPLIEYSAPQTTSVDGGVVTMRLKRSPYLTGTPRRINGVLLAANGVSGGGPAAFELDVPFSAPTAAGSASGATKPGVAKPGATATSATTTAVPPTLLFAIALAFAGGIILNLMPCVFPVVSLKILSFVQAAGDDPRRVRAHGLTFAAGVLVSCWALAALLLALRAAGEEIGWGFQLQSPGFVAAMAFLLFGLGLSLAGVVEIGTSLTRLGGAAASSGHRASFMNGVLATVVATPCTAPFMGAALGYAMTQSAATSMLIFTALGAGMAAPYVALSAWPALLRFLPRPGVWMVRFRQLTAFPLFATVAWLAWVFGHQTGIDGVLRLLLGLTLLALGLWVWGQWVTLSAAERMKWIAGTAAAGFVVAGLVLAATSAPVATAAPSSGAAGGIAWESYSEARVAELRAAGRPVFIDFTAAWCLTCKVNERIAFSSNEVQQLAKARNIAMLKADWTNKDAAITRALAGFGRSGVPLYVLYEADPAAQPRLLPEILSPGILVNAFSEVK